jgi:DNA-directed RNA polymerase subunit beta
LPHAYERTSSTVTSQLLPLPNLVQVQLDSYQWFLRHGLRELFEGFSPIEDFTGKWSLELLDYELGEPKYSLEESRNRDVTYEAPIKARVRLRGVGREVIESPDVYLGDLPLMTERGTFLINGAERVVVSQLSRSPGCYFRETMDYSGKVLYYASVIPAEGAWLEIESDQHDVVTVRIGQTRKFPITTLIRALHSFKEAVPERFEYVALADVVGRTLGATLADTETGEIYAEEGEKVDGHKARKIRRYANSVDTEHLRPRELEVLGLQVLGNGMVGVRCLAPPDICHTTPRFLERYGTQVTLKSPKAADVVGLRAIDEILEKRTKNLIVGAGERITAEQAEAIGAQKYRSLTLLSVSPYIEASLEQDPTNDKDEALRDVYRKVRPGDPVTEEGARSLLRSIFFDLRRYDLARVARHKMNRKLSVDLPVEVRCITVADLLAIVDYMEGLNRGEGSIDDIDHLENKRVRSVGELLQSQLRTGFLRMEKVAKERMTSLDPENMLPQVVLSIKPISASIKSFFGSSQLSQFMDQTNPLAELTHKRRLSAMGPGGLSRQSAKLEVRDVHFSHYGRICPIETPEGPNIGLIGQLSVYSRINEFGFIEAPYRRVIDGRATGDIVYLTADEDDRYAVAPADTPLDPDGRLSVESVTARRGNTYPVLPPAEINFMDVSPMQLVSVATALIPFLENDDANRALMGANMQRQAVPLLRSEAPLIGTGIEGHVARDAGAVVTARRKGIVTQASCERIVVETPAGETDTYNLSSMVRSNQATCIIQKPAVRIGELVEPGQIVADGPCSDNGDLALGKNVLVAFMPWRGYNYEDAILISDRLVRDDVFTSIHIEKYETEARDTKLGPEEVTRDIPNVSEDMLKDLDENGIIRIGAEVSAEDILVGKVAPKGQGELTAEERLIIAIFGKKAEETRDVSLRVPHGEGGTVVDVKVFSRFKYSCMNCQTELNFSKKPERLVCERCEGDLVRLPGDELPAGVNQMVRVFVAQKRPVMEGDKCAGRHGNKGVISRIIPQEDLPFLPDGTPVDIVFNPLGVPSRMNIGQILECHLGVVAKHLGHPFECPIFMGFREEKILSELGAVVEEMRSNVFPEYIEHELKVPITPKKGASCGEILAELARKLEAMSPLEVKRAARRVGASGAAVDWMFEGDPMVIPGSGAMYVPGPDGDGDRRRRFLDEAETTAVAEPRVPEWKIEGEIDARRYAAEKDRIISEIVDAITRNVYGRVGLDDRSAKTTVFDGLTGQPFDLPCTIGWMYVMKLAHLVDDKIHARSTGPYSLVTQQPLGGKAQFGGQRFGEMEVWALEAYGAAYTLQEILTIKSDDVHGRVKTYEAIVKGEQMMEPGIPESFKILANELMSLGLRVTVLDDEGKEVDLKERDLDSEYDRRVPVELQGSLS